MKHVKQTIIDCGDDSVYGDDSGTPMSALLRSKHLILLQNLQTNELWIAYIGMLNTIYVCMYKCAYISTPSSCLVILVSGECMYMRWVLRADLLG